MSEWSMYSHRVDASLCVTYSTYAGGENAIITTAPPALTEITQNHEVIMHVPYQTSSCLENLVCAS